MYSPISRNAPFGNRNVHISVKNGALWDIYLMQYEIYKMGTFHSFSHLLRLLNPPIFRSHLAYVAASVVILAKFERD